MANSPSASRSALSLLISQSTKNFRQRVRYPQPPSSSISLSFTPLIPARTNSVLYVHSPPSFVLLFVTWGRCSLNDRYAVWLCHPKYLVVSCTVCLLIILVIMLSTVNFVIKMVEQGQGIGSLKPKIPQRNFRSIQAKFTKNSYFKPFLGLDRLKF